VRENDAGRELDKIVDDVKPNSTILIRLTAQHALIATLQALLSLTLQQELQNVTRITERIVLIHQATINSSKEKT